VAERAPADGRLAWPPPPTKPKAPRARFRPRPQQRELAPLTYKLPEAIEHLVHPRTKSGVVAGLAMYAVALWLAMDNAMFRRIEAQLVTPVAGWLTGGHPATTSSIVWLGRRTNHVFGLQITNECTSALLLIPLYVMLGSLAIFTGLRLPRILAALLIGTAMILAVNVARVAGIAWSTWRWGFATGYKYSHIFVGSALSLVGFVAAMLGALWIIVREQRPGKVTPSA
jgi:exosortase/archaeosortase family protein